MKAGLADVNRWRLVVGRPELDEVPLHRLLIDDDVEAFVAVLVEVGVGASRGAARGADAEPVGASRCVKKDDPVVLVDELGDVETAAASEAGLRRRHPTHHRARRVECRAHER